MDEHRNTLTQDTDAQAGRWLFALRTVAQSIDDPTVNKYVRGNVRWVRDRMPQNVQDIDDAEVATYMGIVLAIGPPPKQMYHLDETHHFAGDALSVHAWDNAATEFLIASGEKDSWWRISQACIAWWFTTVVKEDEEDGRGNGGSPVR